MKTSGFLQAIVSLFYDKFLWSSFSDTVDTYGLQVVTRVWALRSDTLLLNMRGK